MNIFQMMICIAVLLQASCASHRAYTEQEQRTLAQTKTIWVDVHSDSRTLPTRVAGIIEKVEQDVKDKLARAGFTVAPDRSRADAVLQLAFDFSDGRRREELASSYDSLYRPDAHSIHIGVSLDHKEVGHVLWHGDSVSPPYDLSLANSTIIRYIDVDIQEALFKSTPTATKKE